MIPFHLIFEGYEYGYSQALHKEHQVEDALRIAKQGLEKIHLKLGSCLLLHSFRMNCMILVVQSSFSLLPKEMQRIQKKFSFALQPFYMEQERFEDIIALQSQEPENLLTKWMIARSYQEIEDLDKAYELYQQLSSDLKENPEFLEQYTYLLRELGYFEEAKVQAEAYLKLVPDDVQMQELLETL